MGITFTTKLLMQEDIYTLYHRLRWINFLKLDKEQLVKAMEQSWYVIYAYDQGKLIGTGKVISDGIINGYLCGLGVDPDYRSKGIGTKISKLLVERCKNEELHIQFFCEERLVPFYERMGFEVYEIGMKVKEN